jgi:hypothetical protein
MPVTTIDTEVTLIVVDLQKGIVNSVSIPVPVLSSAPALGLMPSGSQEFIALLAKRSTNK